MICATSVVGYCAVVRKANGGSRRPLLRAVIRLACRISAAIALFVVSSCNEVKVSHDFEIMPNDAMAMERDSTYAVCFSSYFDGKYIQIDVGSWTVFSGRPCLAQYTDERLVVCFNRSGRAWWVDGCQGRLVHYGCRADASMSDSVRIIVDGSAVQGALAPSNKYMLLKKSQQGEYVVYCYSMTLERKNSIPEWPSSD